MRTLVAALTLLFAAPALADTVVALEGDFASPTNDGLATASDGMHYGLRVGSSLLPTPLIDLMFEGHARQLNFDSKLAEERGGWTGFAITGGLRLEADLPMLAPAVFARVGYGEVEAAGSDYMRREDGYIVDLGGALTWRPVPLVGLGLQATWSTLTPFENPNSSRPAEDTWFSAGAHVELRL